MMRNEWLARLKGMAANCKFGASLKQVTLDKFVTGNFCSIENTYYFFFGSFLLMNKNC